MAKACPHIRNAASSQPLSGWRGPCGLANNTALLRAPGSPRMVRARGRPLLDRVRECWSSACGQRVVAYRRSQGMSEALTHAVVVQEMVDSVRSGVMFTASTGNWDHLVIEGAFGLGEEVEAPLRVAPATTRPPATG
ncbi:hypothetical protein HV826_07620 [Myxococcus sp. AM010]|nr:hypothetical protein [Myxococcus sp. AM010]